MKCIYCKSNTKVTNSRARALNSSIWRRRECLSCVAQFSTNELPDYTKSILVLNSDGILSSFCRDKLFLSLYRALGHRKDAITSASELTSTTISKLIRNDISSKPIDIRSIADTAYLILKRYDPMAANIYKAYHRNPTSKN